MLAGMPVIRSTAATRYRGTWSSAGAGDAWLSTAMGSFRQPEQDAVEDVGLAGDHVPKVEHPDELVTGGPAAITSGWPWAITGSAARSATVIAASLSAAAAISDASTAAWWMRRGS